MTPDRKPPLDMSGPPADSGEAYTSEPQPRSGAVLVYVVGAVCIALAVVVAWLVLR
jgi:hypothetical protein